MAWDQWKTPDLHGWVILTTKLKDLQDLPLTWGKGHASYGTIFDIQGHMSSGNSPWWHGLPPLLIVKSRGISNLFGWHPHDCLLNTWLVGLLPVSFGWRLPILFVASDYSVFAWSASLILLVMKAINPPCAWPLNELYFSPSWPKQSQTVCPHWGVLTVSVKVGAWSGCSSWATAFFL